MAVIEVTAGSQDAFVASYQQVRHEVGDSSGCRSIRIVRGVESPRRFLLFVEWDSIAAHEAFRTSDRFGRWRAGVGPHFAAAPQVEHYQDAG